MRIDEGPAQFFGGHVLFGADGPFERVPCFDLNSVAWGHDQDWIEKAAGLEPARRLWDLQRPLIDGHFAAKGLKALYAVPWPPQGLFSIGPVRSSADFKGTRMRTYNPATVRIAELLGATPVDVPMVEVNKALSAGKLDSMITSALTGVENQVWGQIKQYYGINAWFPKNIVFVNQQAFDALPAPVRLAVSQAAAVAVKRGWAMSAAVAEESVIELQRKGIKVEARADEYTLATGIARR